MVSWFMRTVENWCNKVEQRGGKSKYFEGDLERVSKKNPEF